MKKVLAFLLACLMLFSLAACGGGSSNTPDETGEKVLHMRLSKSLASTDWATTTNTSDMQITWVQLFQGLYGIQ